MKKIIMLMVLLLATARVYAAEPTAEEILQKAADNYGKIEDLTADVVSTTTVHADGQPEEILGPYYQKQYQKKPDKSRLETPADDSFLIINGNDIYVKNAAIGLQHMRLDQQTSLDKSQLDFYYDTTKFKETHDLSRIGHVVQEGKNIYTLEIKTKQANQTYSKFILEINYEDGLVLKQEMYNAKDQILVRAELIAAQTQEGINIPVKTRETKYFEDGNTVSDATLSNIKLNTGLSDTIFNP